MRARALRAVIFTVNGLLTVVMLRLKLDIKKLRLASKMKLESEP